MHALRNDATIKSASLDNGDAFLHRDLECGFVGARLERLRATTGLVKDQLKEAPLSGGLFLIDAGVAGLAEVPYQS